MFFPPLIFSWSLSSFTSSRFFYFLFFCFLHAFSPREQQLLYQDASLSWGPRVQRQWDGGQCGPKCTWDDLHMSRMSGDGSKQQQQQQQQLMRMWRALPHPNTPSTMSVCSPWTFPVTSLSQCHMSCLTIWVKMKVRTSHPRSVSPSCGREFLEPL